jgi:hypothetical protein
MESYLSRTNAVMPGIARVGLLLWYRSCGAGTLARHSIHEAETLLALLTASLALRVAILYYFSTMEAPSPAPV